MTGTFLDFKIFLILTRAPSSVGNVESKTIPSFFSDGDSQIDDNEYGLGFVEISFDNKNEMISFLESSQCSEAEIKTLIINEK